MKRKLDQGTSGRGRIGAAAASRTATSGGSTTGGNGSLGGGAFAADAIKASSGKARDTGGGLGLGASRGTCVTSGRGGCRPHAARDTGGSENALTSAFDRIW
jgi:hypothetical protein